MTTKDKRQHQAITGFGWEQLGIGNWERVVGSFSARVKRGVYVRVSNNTHTVLSDNRMKLSVGYTSRFGLLQVQLS